MPDPSCTLVHASTVYDLLSTKQSALLPHVVRQKMAGIMMQIPDRTSVSSMLSAVQLSMGRYHHLTRTKGYSYREEGAHLQSHMPTAAGCSTELLLDLVQSADSFHSLCSAEPSARLAIVRLRKQSRTQAVEKHCKGACSKCVLILTGCSQL